MQNCHGELTGAVEILDKPGVGLMSRIPALDRPVQKNYLKLESSLGYIARPCVRIIININNNKKLK